MQDQRITIPHRPIHIFLFLLLCFLCYEAHQWTRHVVGAALCGGPGSMTFTVSTTRQPCSLPMIVTLSGPVLTYGLEWIGMWLLQRRGRLATFGYALIFASFAPLRPIQTLTGRGDELVLAGWGFGPAARIAVALAIFLSNLPPVRAAFHALANRRRRAFLAASWLLPLPVLFALLVTDKQLFGANDFLAGPNAILGVAPVVLIGNVIAAGLFVLLAWQITNEEDEYEPGNRLR